MMECTLSKPPQADLKLSGGTKSERSQARVPMVTIWASVMLASGLKRGPEVPGIAGDDALARGRGHVVVGIEIDVGALLHVDELALVVLAHVDAHGEDHHLGELLAGDGGLGTESAVRVARYDAELRKSLDLDVVRMRIGHVTETRGLRLRDARGEERGSEHDHERKDKEPCRLQLLASHLATAYQHLLLPTRRVRPSSEPPEASMPRPGALESTSILSWRSRVALQTRG